MEVVGFLVAGFAGVSVLSANVFFFFFFFFFF